MSSDNIQVAVKIRPPIRKEIEEHLQPQWTVQGSSITPVSGYLLSSETYSFDHIFDQSKSNQEMYSSVVKPLVLSALDGFNSTIFAYGQTSSGKTYVMLGSQTVPGIMHLAMNDIFEYIERDQERKYLVKCAYIEIYNETVNDLLNLKKGKDLRLREDREGIPYVIAHEEVVSSVDEVLAVMKNGSRARKIGCTDINERSSRSHTIFRITLNSVSQTATEGPYKEANLNLIDLAGSERIAQTRAEGVRLREGVHINRSLTTLGMVIRKLSEGEQFVNYRDSKLTRLLQTALGGNAKTLMIATITIAAGEETKSTLEFAFRAKHVTNKPILNQKTTDKQALRKYRRMCKEYEQIIAQIKNDFDVKLKLKENLEEKIARIFQYCGESDIRKAELAKSVKRRHTLSVLPASSSSRLPTIPEVEPPRFSEVSDQSRPPDVSFASNTEDQQDVEDIEDQEDVEDIEDEQDVEDIEDDETDRSLSDEEYVEVAVQTSFFELDELIQDIQEEGTQVDIAQETPEFASPETTLVETPTRRRSSITPSPVVRQQLKTLEKSFTDLEHFTRLENEMIGSGEYARFNEIKENHDRLREDLINMQTLLSESLKEKELDKLKYEGFIANLREDIQKIQKESRSQGFLIEQLQVEKEQLKNKNANLENDQQFLVEQLEAKYKSRIKLLEDEINSINQNNTDDGTSQQLEVSNHEYKILKKKFINVSTKLKEHEELICEYDVKYFDLIKKLETETKLKEQALSEKDELRRELKGICSNLISLQNVLQIMPDSTGFQDEVQRVVDENIGDVIVKQQDFNTKFQKIMARIHMSESLVVAQKRAQNKLKLKNKALRRIFKSLKTKTSKIMSQLKKSSKNRKSELISIIKLIHDVGIQITNDGDTISFPRTIPALKEELSKSCQKYRDAIISVISKSKLQQDAKQTQTEFQTQEQECQTDKDSIKFSQEAGCQTMIEALYTESTTEAKQTQTECQTQEQECQTDQASINFNQEAGSQTKTESTTNAKQTQTDYKTQENECQTDKASVKFSQEAGCQTTIEALYTESTTEAKQTQTECQTQEQECQTDKASINFNQEAGSQTKTESTTNAKQTQTDYQTQEKECQTDKASIKYCREAESQTQLLYLDPKSGSSWESSGTKSDEMQQQECQSQKPFTKLSQGQAKLLSFLPESQSSWESVTTKTEFSTESSISDLDFRAMNVELGPEAYSEGNILDDFQMLMTKNLELRQKVKQMTEINEKTESELTALRSSVESLQTELRANKAKAAVCGFKGTPGDMSKLFVQKLIALVDKVDGCKTVTYKQLTELREDIKKDVETAYVDIEKVYLESHQAKIEKDALASAHKRLLEADDKIASLKATLGTMSEENEMLKRDKSNLERKIDDLQTLSERLKADLQANNSINITSQKKITEKDNYIALLKQKLICLDESVTQRCVMKKQMERLQVQLEEQAALIINLRKTSSIYEQEKLEQTQLRQKVERLETLVKKETTEKQQIEKEVQLLKQLNENLNVEMTNLKEKKQTVEFKLANTSRLGQSVSVDEQSLQLKSSPVSKDPFLSDSQIKSTTRDDRGGMSSSRKQRRQSLHDQSRSITPECAEGAGCDFCVDYILKIEEMRKEIEALHKEISLLQTKVTELNKEKDDVASEIHKSDGQTLKLRQESEKLKHDNKVLEKTLREKTMSNVKLTTKIFDLQNELQQKQETFNRKIKSLQQHMELKITKELNNQEVQTDETGDKIKAMIEEYELKIKRIEKKCGSYKYIMKCRTEEGLELRRRLGLTPDEPVLESDIAKYSGGTSKSADKK